MGSVPGWLSTALREMAALKQDIAVTVAYPRMAASKRVTVSAFPA